MHGMCEHTYYYIGKVQTLNSSAFSVYVAIDGYIGTAAK